MHLELTISGYTMHLKLTSSGTSSVKTDAVDATMKLWKVIAVDLAPVMTLHVRLMQWKWCRLLQPARVI